MSSSPAQRQSWKAHLLLVLITAIWGTTFAINKAALQFISPLTFNALRMTVATAALGIFYRRQILSLRAPALRAGLIVGVFMFLGYELQISGLRLTTPSKAAFLTGVSTVLVPLLLIVFWKSRIHLGRAAGIALAFAGLFLMTVPSGKQVWLDFAQVNTGDLLIAACSVAFAFHIILLGRSTQRFPFEQISFLQVATSAVLMLITAPLVEHPHLQPKPVLFVVILITGIVSTAVTFTIQAWAQQFTPATHAALIFTLEPVFASLTSFFFLAERLDLRTGAGALLILAGVLTSELFGAVSQPDQEPEIAPIAVSGNNETRPESV